MLYSIILITRDSDAINNLTGSLGAVVKGSKDKRKRYFDTLAQDTVQQHAHIRSSSKSNGCTYNSNDATITTGSLTQLPLSESNYINNGDTTTTVSRHVVCHDVHHVVCQSPPAITATNIENSVGLMNDDGISLLEMQLGTPSKFDFRSFLVMAAMVMAWVLFFYPLQKINNILVIIVMEIEMVIVILCHLILPLQKKRGRCTGTPSASKGNSQQLFPDNSFPSTVTVVTTAASLSPSLSLSTTTNQLVVETCTPDSKGDHREVVFAGLF